MGFPLAYVILKHYNPAVFIWDTPRYLLMAKFWMTQAVPAPYFYRILSPGIVHFLSQLPTFYHTQISAGLGGLEYRIFLNFIMLNLVWVSLAATCLYFYFRKRFFWSSGFALTASMMVWLSFFTAANVLVPLVDAGAYFFIALALWAAAAGNWRAFVLTLLVGVLQKETVVLVVGVLVGLDLLGQRRDAPDWGLNWFGFSVGIGAATLAYLAFAWFYPASADFNTIKLSATGILAHRSAIGAGFEARSFWLQGLLAYLPFLVALAAHAVWSMVLRRTIKFPMRLLLVFPILVVLTLVLNMDQGRIVSLGFPVYLAYQWVVFAHLWRALDKRELEENQASSIQKRVQSVQ